MSGAETAFIDRTLLHRLPSLRLRAGRSSGLAELGLPAQLNVASVLLDDARNAGMRTALYWRDEAWSLDRLEESARRLANRLIEAHGLVPGNRVLICCPNGPLLMTTLLAAALAGLVSVPVAPGLRAAEFLQVLRDSRPDLIVATPQGRDAIGRASTDIGIVPPFLLCEDGDDAGRERLLGRGPLLSRAVPTAAEDPAVMLFTSGSTGRAKALLHSHRDIVALTRVFGRRVFSVGPEDIVVGSPSLAFAYGYGVLFAASLSQGSAIRLIGPAHSQALAEALEDGACTVLVTAPTAYRKLLANRAGWRGARLRLAVSAGEPLDAELALAFEQASGAHLLDALGSTELLGPYVFGRPAVDGALRRAVPGYELRLVNMPSDPEREKGVGRLAVLGPTGGIWLHESDASNAVQDGWTVTGDLARIDVEGNVTLLGRADDMILSAGHTIAAAEIEAVLAANPDINEAAVIGVPDAERGTAVVALVRPAQGAVPDAALALSIMTATARHLASWKCPRRIVFCEKLPRTATGKIRRADLPSLLDQKIE
ncbi:MAG: AMP-binding protein [Rhodothalassiaceae bacterium]